MNLTPAPNGWMRQDDPGEVGPDGNRQQKRWSINAVEAKLVSELCRDLRVLEIGTGLGVSTKEIAKLAKFVYTVDIDEWVEKVIAPTLPNNVIFFNNTHDIEYIKVEAAFIDGLHTYEQCCKDIDFAKSVVKPDGLLIFHDLYISGVHSAICEKLPDFVEIKTYAGIGIAWNG